MNGPVPGTPSDFYARMLPTDRSRGLEKNSGQTCLADQMEAFIRRIDGGLTDGPLTGHLGALHVTLRSAPPPSHQSPR